MSRKLVDLLSHRHINLIAAGLAIVLVLPSLGLGIVLDDYLQRAMLLKIAPYSDGRSALLTLFDFTDAYPGETQNGLQPWYRSPNLRLGFFRPLSSATHVLDYALWPDNFVLQHLHSIAWYAAGVLLVGLFYRRLGGGGAAVAGLAVLMFAVEDSHSMPASWLSNRNSLVALAFSMIALLFHLRWRRDGSRAALAGALFALAAGLLAGESAIAASAYLFAYQLFLDRGSLPRRMLALVPYAILILAWRAVYVGLGFGTIGCGIYFDPATSPVRFAVYLPGRMALLMASQWYPVQTEPLMLASMAGRIAGGVAAAILDGLIAWFFWPLLKKDPWARFWALGMVLCLVPISAAFVMDRNLIFAGIGAFGLLALMARETGMLGERGAGEATIGGWRRPATRVLVFIHLWLALVLLPLRVMSIHYGFGSFSRIADLIPKDESIKDKTLFWLNGGEFFTCYAPLINVIRGVPAPRANYQLGFMAGGQLVRRTGEKSLLIRQEKGFMPTLTDQLLWSPETKFKVGQRIDKREFEAVVREVLPDGRPAVVEFTFARSLDSPDYVFMCIDGRIDVCRPPEIGEERRLSGATLGMLRQF